MKKEAVVVGVAATATAVIGITILVRHWRRGSERRWRHAQRILRKFARECSIPVPELWLVVRDLVSDMKVGLASNDSNVGMLSTYGSSLPTGVEKGLYYGINLRATTFLMLRARLGGKNEPISDLYREEVEIPSSVINGSSKELFDLIALELAKFISINSESSEEIRSKDRKLGFTISYPVEEAAIYSGTSIKWKRPSLDETAENELVNDMNQALENHSVALSVFAMVDDAIGNLAGGRYYNTDSVASITLGMSTNVAYTESANLVSKWEGEIPKSGEIVINMQWGNFKSNNLPITEFDHSLDAESTDPGTHMYEKLISGMYLGEIVRRVLLKIAQETALFGSTVPIKLATPYILRSPDMAAIHQDTSENYEVVDEKLKKVLGICDSTPMVREIVAEVCDVVCERAARLVGAGIVGIVKKLDRITKNKSVITIEGGLYEHYRVFRNYLHSSVWEILGGDLSDNVIIENAHGGSGAGSIFLAAAQTQDVGS